MSFFLFISTSVFDWKYFFVHIVQNTLQICRDFLSKVNSDCKYATNVYILFGI